MKASVASMLSPATAPAHDWNWRAELADLDVSLDHVQSGSRWNWRRELAEIEAELDRLAERLGL